MVNRTVDYGFNWTFYKENDVEFENNDDSIIFQQIKFFQEEDKNKKGYIKALYLHHLLDFFKETHVNISDLDLVFEKFLQEKVLVEFSDPEGKKLNFQEEINEIFDLIRKNKKELFNDLKS